MNAESSYIVSGLSKLRSHLFPEHLLSSKNFYVNRMEKTCSWFGLEWIFFQIRFLDMNLNTRKLRSTKVLVDDLSSSTFMDGRKNGKLNIIITVTLVISIFLFSIVESNWCFLCSKNGPVSCVPSPHEETLSLQHISSTSPRLHYVLALFGRCSVF